MAATSPAKGSVPATSFPSPVSCPSISKTGKAKQRRESSRVNVSALGLYIRIPSSVRCRLDLPLWRRQSGSVVVEP